MTFAYPSSCWAVLSIASHSKLDKLISSCFVHKLNSQPFPLTLSHTLFQLKVVFVFVYILHWARTGEDLKSWRLLGKIGKILSSEWEKSHTWHEFSSRWKKFNKVCRSVSRDGKIIVQRNCKFAVQLFAVRVWVFHLVRIPRSPIGALWEMLQWAQLASLDSFHSCQNAAFLLQIETSATWRWSPFDLLKNCFIRLNVNVNSRILGNNCKTLQNAIWNQNSSTINSIQWLVNNYFTIIFIFHCSRTIEIMFDEVWTGLGKPGNYLYSLFTDSHRIIYWSNQFSILSFLITEHWTARANNRLFTSCSMLRVPHAPWWPLPSMVPSIWCPPRI